MSKYTDKIKETSDSHLIRIVTSYKDDYEPEAVAEAERELQLRNIPESEWKVLKDKAVHDRFVHETNKNVPLGGVEKALTFVFPLVITLILSRYFYSKGFIRKGDELAIWTFYGFIMYMGLAIILGGLYMLSNYGSF